MERRPSHLQHVPRKVPLAIGDGKRRNGFVSRYDVSIERPAVWRMSPGIAGKDPCSVRYPRKCATGVLGRGNLLERLLSRAGANRGEAGSDRSPLRAASGGLDFTP